MDNGTATGTEEMSRAFARSIALPIRQEPTPPRAPDPTPYTPEWDERVHTMFVLFVHIWMSRGFIGAMSMLFAKMFLASWLACWRSWSMLRAVLGPRVTDAEYVARMVACGECPQRVDVGSKKYCGPCRCPHWILSRLDKKNHFRRWRCPEGRHVGSVKRKCAGCG